MTQPKTAAPRATPNGSAVPLPPQFRIATGGGQPLAPAVRQKMEAAFGQRFDDVRVHVGTEAQAIGAVAFTHGTHIHFAPGQYAPQTPRGQQVLAHELAHVVQQRSGRVRNPFGAGVAVIRDALLECEADRLAHRALTAASASGAVQRHTPGRGLIVQRAEAQDDEKWYSNDSGGGLQEAYYLELRKRIRKYDVHFRDDFSRKESGAQDGLTQIAIGLTSILDYVEVEKELKKMLKYIVHPGDRTASRNGKYGGKTFLQILAMCKEGTECNNDLAQALDECLGTLSLS